MANSEWRATEGPVRFVCAHCGSDEVRGSASVTWDEEMQMWGVEGFIDAMHCNACDRENVEVHEVQILNKPEIPVFIRSKRNTEGAA
jgi:transposase-like protein